MPAVPALVSGQKAEESLGCLLFPFLFVKIAGNIKGKGIAGIDFHDVMDEDHFGHVDRVNRLVGVFGQEQGHEGQLPTMLGGVLVAALPGLRVGHDVGVPDHLFEAVGL